LELRSVWTNFARADRIGSILPVNHPIIDVYFSNMYITTLRIGVWIWIWICEWICICICTCICACIFHGCLGCDEPSSTLQGQLHTKPTTHHLGSPSRGRACWQHTHTSFV